MSRVFSKGPGPGPKAKSPPAPAPAPAVGGEQPRVAEAAAHQAAAAVEGSAARGPLVAPAPAPRKVRTATFTQASTEELIDELRAIAGNDGERVNTVEGRETATEYSRRVKASIAEREGLEEAKLRAALETVQKLELSTGAGCVGAAQLLCSVLADGVLTNSLAVASAIILYILADEPHPEAIPEGSMSLTASEASAHESASFASLASAAQRFLAHGHGAGDAESARARACIVMWLGAVFLNVFVSANWTGPPLKDLAISPLPWHASIKAGSTSEVGKMAKDGAGASEVQEALETASKQSLEQDSEMFYRGAVAPMYLRAALILVVDVEFTIVPATLAWWGARALGTQQRLLLGRSSTLHDRLFILWEEAEEHMTKNLAAAAEAGAQGGRRDRDARLHLEIALAHSSFYNDAEAEKSFEKARARSGLAFEVTGKIGIRRKFQTNHLPQLVCLANSRPADAASSSADDDHSPATATTGSRGHGVADAGSSAASDGAPVGGDDDGIGPENDGYRRTVGAGVTVVEKNEECDILDGVRLDEGQDVEEQRALSNVDQAILLTVCSWNRRNRARDEMNRETQGALVDRVMLHPTNWIVFTTCLLSRCRIELTKVQTVDRACMQMQVLSEQYFDEEPGVSERVAFIYSVPYPPRWSLKKELADSMMKIGMLRTAANVYEELGLYKEMVECYIAQEEEEEAEKIVRKQLEKERSPYMLAVMGFITDEVSWYEASWEESGRRFALARRWHAQHCYRKGEMKAAVALFEEALAISNFYPDSWFKLGCAAMREEQWATAVKAFHRVINLEPESYESWGNIGAVHMGQSNFEGALQAFEEALRLRRDSWKMWENYRQAALNLNRWGLVLNATCELLNLKEKEVDVPILAMLVQEAAQRMESDASGASCQGEGGGHQEARATKQLCERLDVLLKAVSASVVDDPKFWQVYAAWHAAKGEWRAELECRRKVLRAAQMGAWHTEADLFKEVVAALSLVTEAYLREGSSQSLFAAKSALNGALAKCRNSFENTDGYKSLQALLNEVKKAQASAVPSGSGTEEISLVRSK